MLSLKRPGKETEPKKEKMDYILQEKIDGTLNLAEGTVSELTVWLHDRPEMTVTVTGDMAQTAKNQPLGQNYSAQRRIPETKSLRLCLPLRR